MRQQGYAEPQPKVGSVSQARALPVKRNEEFLLVHLPERWDFVQHRGEPRWVPHLSRIPLKRGANGIDTYGSPAAYIGKIQQMGGVAFAHGDKRLGPYRDFVLTVPCEHKGRAGTFHLTPYERPVVLGGVTRFEIDSDGYYDMKSWLVEQGVVEPMSKVVLLNLLEQQDRRIRSIEDRAASAPHLLKRLDEARSKRDQMERTWEAQFGENREPEPKRRNRKPAAEPE